jgi:hypothetical protein
MLRGSSAKILGGDMQIDLRARNLSMSEEISNGDETNPGTNQMRCKRMAQSMR